MHPKIVNRGIQIAGISIFLACGFTALFFFVKYERILLVFPGLARHASVEDLVRQPENYLERWVITKGRIFAVSGYEAIIIPDSDVELHVSSKSLYQHLNKGNSLRDSWTKSATDYGSRGSMFPENSLYIHELKVFGIRTFNWAEVEENRIFTFVGEFEDFGYAPGNPHLDIVGSVSPLQRYSLLITILSVLIIGLGGACSGIMVLQTFRGDRAFSRKSS